MTYLEKRIIKLSKEIETYKTKQKRICSFDKYLNDWEIYRLTDTKRKEIINLLNCYNLEFIIPYKDEKVDLLNAKREDRIVLKYCENLSFESVKIEGKRTGNSSKPIISIVDGVCPKIPRPFQEEAFKKLNKFYNGKTKKSGLLVLPTGAGKTFTALRWLLHNVVNENKKVIWIAHRHELLNQAYKEIVQLSYSNILPNKNENKIYVQLISGKHQGSRNMSSKADIMIAGIQTLNNNLERLKNRFLVKNDDVFLVIDEAHHGTARTYMALINTVKENCKNFNILGLTATPFTTETKNKPSLAKVFEPKPIFTQNLIDLIPRFLSTPKFIPIETNENFAKKDFTLEEQKLLQSNFDLPAKIKKKIIERSGRNKLIVNHYIEKKNLYKQTLVFALDQNHAIQLDALFKEKGINSEYVISGTQSSIGISTDKEANEQTINNFRNNKLDVLINVNILTEGTDLPNTQTVFLTRPTKSKTLMTQMVGRALRGVEAGGTEIAYIVSFVDNWSDLVSWESPEVLFEDSIEYVDNIKQKRKSHQIKFISIELVQQYSKLANDIDDTTMLESLPAIMRIPVGWYYFGLEYRLEDEDLDYGSNKVLVFEQHLQAFEALNNNFENLFKKFDYNKNNNLEENEKNDLLKEIIQEFFDIIEYPEPEIQIKSLRNIIEYYNLHRTMPPFFNFEEREQYNISLLVNEIINKEFSAIEEASFITGKWNGEGNHKTIWQEYFINNFRYFKKEIDIEKAKLLYPEMYKITKLPTIENYKEKLEDLRLQEWPPSEYRNMLEAVYEKWNNENPTKTIEKKDRFKYDIDHKIRFNDGGKTSLDNLSPLLRSKHKKKG